MTFRDRSYTLGGVITMGAEAHFADKHFAAPGRVVRYDASTRQADVKVCVQVSYYNEAGDEVMETLPIIPAVPVVFPGGNGYTVTFPIKADPDNGDTVLLVFSEVSLDEWLANGGNDIPPEDLRKCHVTDAIAIPGLRDFAHVAAAATDHMVVGQENGLAIHIDSNLIKIGTTDAGSLDSVALGQAVTSVLNNILSFLGTHTHTGVATGLGATGPSASPPPAMPNIKSSVVMVKV